MPVQRLLAVSILLVLSATAAAGPLSQPDASSGVPDINGGTVTQIRYPGAPPGTVLAPAATRPRAGVDVLVDRPSALGAGSTPEAPITSEGPDPFAGLAPRPSALAPVTAAPQPSATVAPTTPSAPRSTAVSRPRAVAQVFALGSAPRAPHREPGPITRASRVSRDTRRAVADAPMMTSVLPDLTVFAKPLSSASVDLLPPIPVESVGAYKPRFSLLPHVERPPAAMMVIASVLVHPLDVAPGPESLPRVPVSLPTPAVEPRAELAVADLPVHGMAAEVRPVGVVRAPAPVVVNPLIAIRANHALAIAAVDVPRAAPERSVIAAVNRSGLTPISADMATSGDAASSVDVVLAQVAVLERQVAIQQARTSDRYAEVAAQMTRLRNERARLAAATQVAMEQYVDTSPLPR